MHDSALEHVAEVYRSAQSLVCTALSCTHYDANGHIVVDATFAAFQNEIKRKVMDLRNFIDLQEHAGAALLQGACPRQFHYRPACAYSCVCDAHITQLALALANLDALGELFATCAAQQLRRTLLSALSMLEMTQAHS